MRGSEVCHSGLEVIKIRVLSLSASDTHRTIESKTGSPGLGLWGDCGGLWGTVRCHCLINTDFCYGQEIQFCC